MNYYLTDDTNYIMNKGLNLLLGYEYEKNVYSLSII